MENTETISMSEACAQAFVFFVAGFETSSTTSTYCLHELALNSDIQDKLRQEINKKLAGRNDLSYEDVHALPYLDKVVSGIYYSTYSLIKKHDFFIQLSTS